jgi:hypothetical protein
MKRGFYHDGRFATLLDVVNQYDGFKHLNLTEAVRALTEGSGWNYIPKISAAR